MVNRLPWFKFNVKYYVMHNCKLILINKIDIIKDGINKLKSIIFKFKSYFIDYNKIIQFIYLGKFNQIGRWSLMPKVHKKDAEGNQIKKIRPIINMKYSITTISSTIIKEITRKIIFGLKSMYESKYECDDIRDIIININKYNNENKLNDNDQLIVCDINSMYDNISKDDVINAFNKAINEFLPINYISQELIKLWYKSINHLFNYCYFEYQENIYLQTNSQIQGDYQEEIHVH